MPLDSSIYSMIQPVQPAPDPIGQYGKVLSLQNMMGQQDVQALQTQKLRRDINYEDSFRKQFENGATPSVQSLMAVDPVRGMQYQKNLLEQQKSAADLKKVNLETLDKALSIHRDQLSGVNDPQAAAQWVMAGFNDPTLSPFLQRVGSPQDLIAKIPQDQQGFQAWKMQNGLGIQKMMEMTAPKMAAVDTGKTSVLRETNPLAPGFSAAPVLKTTTPGEDLSNTRAISEGALNRGVTMRGQNMTDVRDRQVAGITDTGTPTAEVETMAQGIAAGRLAPINGFALARPRGQAIMARVMDINPNYDAGDYAAKNTALKGFATGKEGTSLRSLNVATDHLGTLGDMADALNNRDTTLLNKAANIWKANTGQDAPTNFDAVKEIVGKEVVKAIVAGGGGVGEREELSKLMDKANSPKQLKGVITHFQELMDAQRSGLMDQYQRTTGRTDGAATFAPSKVRTKPDTSGATQADIDAELRRRGIIK